MTDAEIRLQCLEMALGIARAEGKVGDRHFVAETQTWLYNSVVISPGPPHSGLTGEPGTVRLDKTRK